ncbi:uncharacterized protein LACBIDRAFT_318422 [Laccaria bicolor S238N-H82]|uniref:Predicted protein n=1 Tax=Laccaria bicolor (strain S238N-H82 / ATCC MYA-4686) TaxID=486041 RepID=B0E2E6_LACBS|nr:uncharacterized protein LACBIDRAFT_318422 [Laccaria bicolor S238N-H82]EDQ98967.1 predicted protein [Laccaria bicolor S238N-H82]|eukprot:XP_001890369.1 predicted protein [Laccaria bicolor S238N-H82]
MATSNDTLNTPIPSDPSQSVLGNEQGPNQNQGDQELREEGQPQIQDQNPEQDDNEQDDPSLPGNFPAANAVLASCNSVLEDFRSSRIPKATALSRIYTHLLDGIPDNDNSFASTVEEAFARYLTIVENHQHHLREAEHRGGRRQRSKTPPDNHVERGNPGPDNDQSPHKRAKPDEAQYPWIISDFIHRVTLSPLLTSTLELLKLYAIDPKGTKRSLVNSPTCPEFPDSEWTNILAGRAINLDAVLSGYYLVFESPVRSGFLMPRGVNRNRNWSAFSPEVKRPDRTAKRPQTAVFCGL